MLVQPRLDDSTLRALAATFAEREGRDSETYPAQKIVDFKAPRWSARRSRPRSAASAGR